MHKRVVKHVGRKRPSSAGYERRIAMNKHDEQFAETIKSLKEHATCFDEYVSIQLLKELHEIHTSLDNINDNLDSMDTSFTGIGDVIADAGDSIAESVDKLSDEN